jgi:hypothetical protein
MVIVITDHAASNRKHTSLAIVCDATRWSLGGSTDWSGSWPQHPTTDVGDTQLGGHRRILFVGKGPRRSSNVRLQILDKFCFPHTLWAPLRLKVVKAARILAKSVKDVYFFDVQMQSLRENSTYKVHLTAVKLHFI